MMNAQDVRDNLTAALNQHRALVQVAAMLDEIVSFEQATTEAKDARDKAIRERDAAIAGKAQAAAGLASAKDAVAAAVERGRLTDESAKAQADTTVADAAHQASVLVNTAQQQAAEIDAQSFVARTALDDVRAKVVAAQSEYDGLAAKIAAVKAEFRSLVN